MRAMKLFSAALIALSLCGSVAAQNRWSIMPDGKTIRMEVGEATAPHADHIEMSGKFMAVVLYWDVDKEGVFGVNRSLVFPMLRTEIGRAHV